MPIKGLSEKRRLPRMGKIKLGIKVSNKSGGGEHPEETDYFVCPEIVQRAYSPKPKELLIVLPTEDKEIFFPQYLKRWGDGVLLCKGDGERANCWDFDHGGLKEITCPCPALEAGKCKASATLKFLLPEVEECAGIYEITTGNKDSIQDINSGIDYIRSITKGKIAWIPIKLIRVPASSHRVEGTAITVSTHYPIKFSLEGVSLRALMQYANLDPLALLLPAADADADADPRDIAPSPPLPAEILNAAQEDLSKDPGSFVDQRGLGAAPDPAHDHTEALEAGGDQHTQQLGLTPAAPSLAAPLLSEPLQAASRETQLSQPDPAAGQATDEIEALCLKLEAAMNDFTEAGGTVNDIMRQKAQRCATPEQFGVQTQFYKNQAAQMRKNRGGS